jgi:hypothetical protein
MLGVDVVHTNSLFDASYSYDLYSWCLSCLAATNRAATYRSTCVSSWNTWRAVISCTIFKCKSPLNLRDTEETESWPIGLEALLHKCLLACLRTHALAASHLCLHTISVLLQSSLHMFGERPSMLLVLHLCNGLHACNG